MRSLKDGMKAALLIFWATVMTLRSIPALIKVNTKSETP